MKYKIYTFGCQMNYSDSERLTAVLDMRGGEKVEDINDAELIIMNTCSVKQQSEDKVLGLGNNLAKLKKKKLILAVTGCMAADKKLLQKRASWLDFCFEIKDLSKLPLMLSEYFEIKNNDGIANEYLDIVSQAESKYQSWIPIMTGCNNFCAYCIVPYTRGREISRKSSEIINEATRYANKNYKEIILLGQNVNSYICPETKINFPELLKKINKINGKFWIRYTSSHPKDMSDELIDQYGKLEKLADELHLPVQSGSNSELQRMNRDYTIEHYLDLINRVKINKPNIVVSTDLILGFPGQTDDEFADTKKLIKQVNFDMIYFSKYSPRPNTLAIKTMKDNVSREKKDEYWKSIDDTLKQSSSKNNGLLLGNEYEILVDKIEKDKIMGHTKSMKKVQINITNNSISIGDFVNIKVTGSHMWYLDGEIISSSGDENHIK